MGWPSDQFAPGRRLIVTSIPPELVSLTPPFETVGTFVASWP